MKMNQCITSFKGLETKNAKNTKDKKSEKTGGKLSSIIET